MPSKTVNLDTGQLSYIDAYADEHDLNFSEATRELIDSGIEWEERGSDTL